MVGYVFWAQIDQMWFLGPRPKDQDIFGDFIILFHSSRDSGKNGVLFLKVGAKVLELWLDMFSGHK